MNINEWLESGKYLPAILRDFHDQKDIFKAIHRIIKEPDESSLIKRPTWIEGQVYVIDVFLWFMAKRGYTLQRTRQRAEFRDIHEDVKSANRDRDNEIFAAIQEGKA